MDGWLLRGTAASALAVAVWVSVAGLRAPGAGLGGGPWGAAAGAEEDRVAELFADLPTRSGLDDDTARIARRFEVGASREPERVRGLTAAQAERYIRSGRPFIVTDMVEGWGMRDWDCDSVRRDFGQEEMELWNSYDGGSQPRTVRLAEPWQQWAFPQQQEGEAAAASIDRAGGGEQGAKAGGEGCESDMGPTASPSTLSFHWCAPSTPLRCRPLEPQGGDMRRYPLNGGAGASPNEPVFGSSPRSIRRLQGAYALPEFLPQESELNQRFCKVRHATEADTSGGWAWLSHGPLCTRRIGWRCSSACLGRGPSCTRTR